MSGIFIFKQFSIDQSDAPFKVGTDGVLLGALCPNTGIKKALDIGTGTGLIALMLAQRTNATIDAVEFNPIAAQIAQKNFEQSKWSNRLSVQHTNIQEFKRDLKYDLIVSNPPYFEDSIKSQNINSSAARHTDTLGIDELLYHSLRLLNNSGKLCIIYPTDQAIRCIEHAKSLGLYCTRKSEYKANSEQRGKTNVYRTSITGGSFHRYNIYYRTKW